MARIHHATKQASDSLAIAAYFRPVWSGILVVDGKYLRVFDRLSVMLDPNAFSLEEKRAMNMKVWLCGIDAGTGDLPHYALADEETMIDLVLYFQTLKKIGYVLRVLVCDGNPDIVRAARKIYGHDFLVQLCVRHFLENCRRRVVEAGTQNDPATIKLLAIIRSIIVARSLDDALSNLVDFRRQQFRHPLHRELRSLLLGRLAELTTYLVHTELFIPGTTNDIENLFRQLNLRLRSLGRFGHFRFANDYLKTWAFWRRTTPYTDCRGCRRKRNGKSPLQLAGCRLTVDIDVFSPLKPTEI